MNRAIGCTVAALLICLVIVVFFLGAFFSWDVWRAAGWLLIAALASPGVGLVAFFQEVDLATRNLRIGPH